MSVEEARQLLETEKTNEDFLKNYVDDTTDEEIWESIQQTSGITQQKPSLQLIRNKALESIVLIDDIPKTNSGKFDRLKQVVLKKINETLTKQGVNTETEKGIEIVKDFFPFNESENSSTGFALFQLKSEQQATRFQQIFNNFKHTKSVTWRTYNLSTIDKYKNVPSVFEPPMMKTKEVSGELEDWLNDGNDQFLMYGKEVAQVCLNQCGHGETKVMAPTGPKILMDNPRFCGGYNLQWSPKGTYFLVFDHMNRGIGLFGGKDFRNKEKFECSMAFNASFSPDEKHILLQSGKTDEFGYFIESDVKPEVSVWSLLDNERKKKFVFSPGMHCAAAWDRFQWSHDGRYLGTTRQNYLCVFDAHDNFKQVNDKSNGNPTGEHIYIPGLVDYSFSPTDSFVCYWVPEEGERPLRVVIKDLTTLDSIRVKNLFNVKELEMVWHPQGTYLALKCNKTVKGKIKAGILHTSFELFHIKEREIPVDIVELDAKVETGNFAWEPFGSRLAVVYGPNENNQTVTRTHIRFFKLTTTGVKVREIGAKNDGKIEKGKHGGLERTDAFNYLSWSPKGRYLFLAQCKQDQGSGGKLEWIDVDGESFLDNKKKYKKGTEHKPVSIAQGNHQFVTDIEWDPSGRYVVTVASSFKHSYENGVHMWSFLGKDLWAKKCDVGLFKWRPRPKTELTQEQITNVKANLSSFAKKFAEQDALRSSMVSEEEQNKINAVLEIWRERLAEYEPMIQEQREMVHELFDNDSDNDYEEVEISTLLKSQEEYVGEGRW